MTLKSTLPRYITAIGYLITIAGCSAITGWQFDITPLKSLAYGVTPMNPISASMFILTGIWLLLYRNEKYRAVSFLICAIVTIVGVIHFVTYLYPISIRMDFLLYTEKLKSSRLPNLIAPNTALIFTLDGICMFTVSSRSQRMQIVRQVLIMLCFVQVYICILGYLYEIQPAYRLGKYSPMALFTACTFLFLNAGLLLSNTEYAISGFFVSSLNGSHILRRVIVFMLVVPPATGYFRLLGEKMGYYPSEVGVELNTLLFTIAVVVLVVMYALLENKKQIQHLRAERQLAASEEKFRTVFQLLKEGVACIDFEGRVLYCNPSYCEIIGYTEEEITGKVVIEMIIPDNERQEFYKLLKERKAGREADYQALMTKKNGERIWIDIKSKTMNDDNGQACAYLVSINDITEQRLKLQDMQAFTGSAAHDLNAPLGRIQTMVEFLQEDNITDTEKKMFLSAIADTTRSMKQLLQDLLSFSKLSTTQLEKKELDIDNIVRSICTSLTPASFKGAITVHELPAVTGNEGAIKQLFTNLISNAIKYSSKTDFTQIEIGAYRKSGQTVYYVKDNGVGLTQVQIGTLFTPFKRYHSDFEGNGLGLAIVKRVIEKHSGNIWAESVPGNGLTFNFTLEPAGSRNAAQAI